jgi:hypothetical protein
MLLWFLVAAVAAFGLGAYLGSRSSSQAAGVEAADTTTAEQTTTLSPTTTTTPPSTTTTVATTTTVPPTTTTAPATTTSPPTTVAPAVDLPTYSEVVAAYPPGVEPCVSRGEISGGEGGNYTILAGAILDPEQGLFCIGSQYTTVGQTWLPDGTPLAEGSFVTIDGEGNMIQVASFD